jgi:hypothetical protein
MPIAGKGCAPTGPLTITRISEKAPGARSRATSDQGQELAGQDLVWFGVGRGDMRHERTPGETANAPGPWLTTTRQDPVRRATPC